MFLRELLERRRSAGAPAVIFDDVTLSHGDLAVAISHASLRLRQAGVGPGSKVMIALPNSLSSLIAVLAVNEAGGVFLPINPNLAADERRRIDELARPDFLIAEHGASKLLSGAHLSRGEGPTYEHEDLTDLAAILFTSGTTGSPRGVMMTEAALLANAEAVAAYLRLSERDRTLVFLPLSYAYALSQVLSTLAAGGCLVLLRDLRYPTLALAAIEQYRVTGFGGVPTSLTILTRHKGIARTKKESLRYILSAGGVLAPLLVERVQREFPRAALFNNYGCTEIGPRATTVDYTVHPDKVGSIGRPISGVDASVMRPDLSVAAVGETGEIVLGGPSLMKGYYRDPDGTVSRMSRRGFHTGDYAYADADGFLYYRGREDDIFKSAGEKVSASEVEEVVLAHEQIAEAAVISRPDAMLGAVPVVYAVLRPGASCTDRDLQAFCARRLPRHKVPSAVHFVDELRKTATGKIQKHWLTQTPQ